MSVTRIFLAALLLYCSFINAAWGKVLSPVVTTPLGKIEGLIEETINGRQFFAFPGVPYAEPPIGQNRFKAPIPVKSWPGTWKANLYFQCMQYNHYSQDEKGNYLITGDEDCLYLNIYTPKLEKDANLDVLVYIHGGAFMFGNGGIYRPDYLLDRDIIVVTLNYRLGPLGFLSTEDKVIPGNNGLKDQTLALKWVNENIQYFGGNSNSITIMGMSAGGASVHFHYLMPQSKGLFHKGFSQSGVSLNAWVLLENPLEKTKKLASIVGCPTKDSKEIRKCLRKLPARKIVQGVSHYQHWLYNPFSPFGVVVDKWAEEPVLPDHPYLLLKNRKLQDLPWLSSYVSSEGLYPASDFYKDQYLKELDEKWNEIMPFVLHYNCSVDPSKRDEVSQKIRKYYLGDDPVNKKTYPKLVQLIGDRLFVADIEKGTRLSNIAIKSPVYSYYFDYRGTQSCTEARTGTKDNIGVSHADDTNYILKCFMDTQTTDDDKKMTNLMVDMTVSFMKDGHPNISPEWVPLSKNPGDPFRQLRINGPDDLIMEHKDILGNREFWESLPFKENENLFNFKDEL